MSEQTTTLVEPARAARPAALWRNRDFLLIWSGGVVSAIGTQVSALAFPLLTLAVTGSPAWAGALAALRGLPFIILGLPVGALVDRLDRRRVMIVSDLGRAIALGSVPLALALGLLTLPHLALVTLIEGLLFIAFSVAEVASLPRVVPEAQLPDAVARGQASESAAELAGPSLGGLLYSLGQALPFLLDAISFAASAALLGLVRADLRAPQAEATTSPTPRRLLAEIGEGLRWLGGQPVLRSLALLVGGLNLFSFGYALILILLARQLGAGPAEIGLIFGSGGLGGILGALAVAPLRRRVPLGRLILGAAWVWALTWPLYALAPGLAWLALANLLGFIVVPILMGAQLSYRLSVIPDALQGRVNSLFRLITFGVQPLSLLLAGLLLDRVGPVTTVWLVTVPQVLLALAATLYRPLRQAR